MLLYNYIDGDVKFELQSVNMVWNRNFYCFKKFWILVTYFSDLVERHLRTCRSFFFLTADKKVGFLYPGQKEKMKCVHRNNEMCP